VKKQLFQEDIANCKEYISLHMARSVYLQS